MMPNASPPCSVRSPKSARRLTDRLGPDPHAWTWGAIHRLGAIHPAASTPLQHELLDIPYAPSPGGAGTLASAFYNPPGSFDNRLGASYRMVTNMGPHPVFRSITWPGQSGHPGSPHYADQTGDHRTGHFVELVTDWPTIESTLHLRNHARTGDRTDLADERRKQRGNLIRCQTSIPALQPPGSDATTAHKPAVASPFMATPAQMVAIIGDAT